MSHKRLVIDNKTQCLSCHKWLPLECFIKCSQTSSGVRGRCKGCWRNQEYDVITNLILSSRRRAKLKNRVHSICKKDIINLLHKQNGLCAITGIPLSIEVDPRYKGRRLCPLNRISLDRINNQKGYSIDNIQLVCDFVNRFRNYASLDDFFTFCAIVSNHNRNKINKELFLNQFNDLVQVK